MNFKTLKNPAVLLVALILAVSISFARSEEPKSDIMIIAVKSHSVYFKVDESLVGGRVEVYDANKTLLEAEELPNAHTKVFFNEKPSGKIHDQSKKRK